MTDNNRVLRLTVGPLRDRFSRYRTLFCRLKKKLKEIFKKRAKTTTKIHLSMELHNFIFFYHILLIFNFADVPKWEQLKNAKMKLR